MHIVACYMDKKTNNFLLIFICLRGKKDFLSANIFCGVFEKKKKQWKEWKTWKIHILNSWTKTASSFFFFLPSHFHLGFKKNHSLILELEPNFQRNTLPGNMHGIPTDNSMKHKRMESDYPV